MAKSRLIDKARKVPPRKSRHPSWHSRLAEAQPKVYREIKDLTLAWIRGEMQAQFPYPADLLRFLHGEGLLDGVTAQAFRHWIRQLEGELASKG